METVPVMVLLLGLGTLDHHPLGDDVHGHGHEAGTQGSRPSAHDIREVRRPVVLLTVSVHETKHGRAGALQGCDVESLGREDSDEGRPEPLVEASHACAAVRRADRLSHGDSAEESTGGKILLLRFADHERIHEGPSQGQPDCAPHQEPLVVDVLPIHLTDGRHFASDLLRETGGWMGGRAEGWMKGTTEENAFSEDLVG